MRQKSESQKRYERRLLLSQVLSCQDGVVGFLRVKIRLNRFGGCAGLTYLLF